MIQESVSATPDTLVPDELTVLIVAPVGRDAKLIAEALASASVSALAVEGVEEATELAGRRNVGLLLITEEVLNEANIAQLSEVVLNQPAWSDLPLLVLTVGGRANALSRQREQDRLPLGSLTLLERPIRIETLISSVRSALLSRSRQYQMRDALRERDLAEEARRESESRLLLALETAQLGAWELDLATGTLSASETCRVIFDWSVEQALSLADFYERVHPEDRTAVEAKLRSTIEQGVPYAAEYRIVWRDGSTRWIAASGDCMRDGKARAIYAAATPAERQESRVSGVSLDVTERILSEQALRKADKLALVGRLASSIAHEINNPLESVTNLLYLLEHAELGDAERAYVATAQQELARITEITSQTLTFNRQQNTYGPAVIADILESVLALYQGRLATSNIEVERRYTRRESVLCYPGELRQVFVNLVGNAFDATRGGGRILVREHVGRHPASGRWGSRITVADTGSGMTRSVQSRIFEVFHSTKGNNGTGLGLWISKSIAEKHGGTLRFSSSTRPGRSGSVFSVFIPHGQESSED